MKTVGSELGGVGHFTPRQHQILDLAGRGFADKEIAQRIGVSEGTVRTHWQRMRNKTEARSRSEILSHALCGKHSRALADVAAKTEAYLVMLNAARQGIALLNESEEVVEVNSAFLELLGLECQEVLGKELSKVRGLRELPSESILVIEGKTMLHVRREVVQVAGRPHWVVSLIPAFTDRLSLTSSFTLA